MNPRGRVYERVKFSKEPFGPRALRPLVGVEKTRHQSWACLVDASRDCGDFLWSDDACEPDHLCETAMRFSVYTEADDAFFFMGEYRSTILSEWPVPATWLELNDFLHERGFSCSPRHPGIINPHVVLGEDCWIGFTAVRLSADRKAYITMYALMEPVWDTEFKEPRWFRFMEPYWQIECSGHLGDHLKWVETTQCQLDSWYRRIILGDTSKPARAARSPKFEENRHLVDMAIKSARQKANGQKVMIPDVFRELQLQPGGVTKDGTPIVARTTLHDWHKRGLFSLDPAAHHDPVDSQ